MREVWEQRLTETDSEYRAFTRWLETSGGRPLPAEPALAHREQWAERAIARDEQLALPTDLPSMLAHCAHSLVRGAMVQAARWSQHTALHPQEIDLQIVLRILQTMAKLQAASQAAAADDFILPSHLTLEELEGIDRAIQLLQAKE